MCAVCACVRCVHVCVFRRRVICLAEAEGKAAKDDTTTWTFREKTNQRNSLLINEFYEKCSLDEHSPNRQIEASQGKMSVQLALLDLAISWL